ncbi:MAG: hypothetical protein K8J08_03725 [Thermoanaerobaculia bacterium]|nr:hypothetical protein [Thermoanaerobaculia bacterium]
MTDAPLPWIVEIRSRLADPAPRRLETEGDRRVVALPLFVDAGELWVMLIRRPEEIGSIIEVGLPGAEASGDADPWSAAQASAAMDLGLQESQVLPLGTLDELLALDGRPTLTCVAAIPFPMPEPRSETKPRIEMLPIPVSALANPRLVEERFLEVEGEQRGLIVLHIGRHRIAGSTAEALQLLLERLEVG